VLAQVKNIFGGGIVVRVTIEIVPFGIEKYTKPLIGIVLGNRGTRDEDRGDYQVNVIDLETGTAEMVFNLDDMPRGTRKTLWQLIWHSMGYFLVRKYGKEACNLWFEERGTTSKKSSASAGKRRKVSRKPTEESSVSGL
jgi:hypothetical protein